MTKLKLVKKETKGTKKMKETKVTKVTKESKVAKKKMSAGVKTKTAKTKISPKTAKVAKVAKVAKTAVNRINASDLFDYVAKKCNFHEDKKKEMRWTCHKDLRFTRQFCKENKLDFEKVRKLLEHSGGYCDCEVLFNSSEKVPTTKVL